MTHHKLLKNGFDERKGYDLFGLGANTFVIGIIGCLDFVSLNDVRICGHGIIVIFVAPRRGKTRASTWLEEPANSVWKRPMSLPS
jgi:hypothetical protein